MTGKIVGLFLGLALAVHSVGVTAQEDAPSKKRVPSKEELEAKAKVRQQRWQAKKKADAELKAKAVDINHATKAELMKLPGIPAEFAAAIIAKRPYKSKAELVTKNAIPKGTYQGLHSLVVAK
ncbi:MAG: helix-hairpin-helix domain-containing protein [Geothrix sp.]|uniref:ComEA family DNA-binding protein n=1 Tax=Geothrix sp. TaxID=1962974 RepID=UPI0017D1E056|nr:helix-hairpin-helix domain-containing protein [Geothrix sp.]NWJ40838.1 helix-hairpin-helix domain-containing protein [Geothrix sp.]WIL21160.1 MAG: helix-hairpin-helix domain-containing protein [Geothrix sp.]